MAANPCPCGYLGDRDRECTCTQADLDRYRRKLSGPIIDRIDMRISMEKVSYDVLSGQRSGMDSAEMRDHVERAISFAKARGQKVFNSEIADCDIEKYCRLGEDENRFMKKAYDAFGMSPRAYSRTVKVARSIADLDSSKDIGQVHLAEALNYRIQE
jgi:magnesium chelatase family protein